jgi:hypothetical protein
MCGCMYAWMMCALYVCMYVYMYICIYMCVCMHGFMCVCMHVCMYVCMYVYMMPQRRTIFLHCDTYMVLACMYRERRIFITHHLYILHTWYVCVYACIYTCAYSMCAGMHTCVFVKIHTY